MCEYCTPQWSGNVGICKPIKFQETASKSNLKDCQIFLHKDEEPALIVFNDVGVASYIDIDYCPRCGRKLNDK